MRITEFVDLFHYMRIQVNAGKKECEPCQLEYEDMDIIRIELISTFDENCHSVYDD